VVNRQDDRSSERVLTISNRRAATLKHLTVSLNRSVYSISATDVLRLPMSGSASDPPECPSDGSAVCFSFPDELTLLRFLTRDGRTTRRWRLAFCGGDARAIAIPIGAGGRRD
jgi:hypothetical protein